MTKFDRLMQNPLHLTGFLHDEVRSGLSGHLPFSRRYVAGAAVALWMSEAVLSASHELPHQAEPWCDAKCPKAGYEADPTSRPCGGPCPRAQPERPAEAQYISCSEKPDDKQRKTSYHSL